uniref:Glucuronosyltransferase n=1 Tax=Panagrolaimus sp. JU765 TaxID=591449 RepID=A0AC34QD98_9BILA
MLDKLFGKNVFDLHELFRNVDLMITNGHELVDISRPTIHKIVKIGGLAVKKPQKLNSHYNSAVYKNRGIGISLEVTELEETAVVHALKRVIFDSKIRENSRLLKDKLASYPFPGNQKFISWIEFVAKFKHFPEFDLHSTKMNFFQLHNLDVYMTILSGILIFAIFFVIIFKQTLSFLTNFIKNEPKIKIN